MRFARIASILALILLLLITGSIVLIAYNQPRVIAFVLASINRRTGVNIVPRSSSITFSNHLVVVLDEPEITAKGRPTIKLKTLRASVGYHSLLTQTGLPLYGLRALNPEVILPVESAETAAIPVPKPGAESVAAIREALQTLGRIAWRVEVIEATVRYADGHPLIEHLGVVAFHKRRNPGQWSLSFDTRISGGPVAGSNAAGKFTIDAFPQTPPVAFGRGQIWTWNVPLKHLEAQGIELVGGLQGHLKFSIKDDGSLIGAVQAGGADLTLKGQGLSTPIKLGDYTLQTALSFSNGLLAFNQLILKHVDRPLVSAETEVVEPFSLNPEIGVKVGGFRLDASGLKQKLLLVRRLPTEVEAMLKRLRPGAVSIGAVTLSASLDKIKTTPLKALRENLVVSAQIESAGFTLPEDLKLPSVEQLGAQLHFEKGVLTIAQGGAKLGNSSIHEVTARVDLANGVEGAKYEAGLAIDADLGDLSPAIFNAMQQYKLDWREHIQRVGGRIDIGATASGALSANNMTPPSDYRVVVTPKGAQVAVKGPPGPFHLSRGMVAITPDRIRFEDLMLAITGGDAVLNGAVSSFREGVEMHDLTLDLHQFPSDLWLSLLVDPSDLALHGPIGGRVILNTARKDPKVILPAGKLTLTKGDVQFNFLRAPIEVQGATVTMDRKTLVLSMPGSLLDKQPIDFTITVPDFRNPSLQIVAVVQKLNFEVMKFIRMPWSPSTTPVNFPLPSSGHIEARFGNLAAFEMSDIKTDFYRKPSGDWSVYNFSANAYSGTMKLDLIGRAQDNWVHLNGSMTDADPAPLFMLGGKIERSPLLGRMSIGADLWANTDTDFYNTMAGDVSLTVRDGTLDKFTLLSRLLSFIDIKNWLTAQIPDPRITGVPFKTLLADFRGSGGVFSTDNFILHGPVMDITATGSIRFSDSTLDMQVGMFPFDTVDWVLNKIPLIGERVGSGTGKLVAAYFQVQGPIGDPSITPKPITSVAEFVMKALGMPINIIRPHTIK
ncbi:MAG: AsmA-like C-terminal domain-containing protein [Candidatus Binatus sp.]|uniref:AsmA-like C-terminal domain-containing protein n=1 Tax=Candidatus Binatus sp. TaxID=2811406 RepID=UPI002728C114|nr:AsmA-like C-terminal domain-containing protein [Candidatus Binatus sp.]MDO8433892.1 AsmA-like C-terminal domain-containing protein [Candidatus Binatus sp.]